MFSFAAPGPRRRPSLTPMIDVVFLLLVFFMLAARFGQDTALPLAAGGGGGQWQGAPRLVGIEPDTTRLNGVPVALDDLPAALAPLMPHADAPVLLHPDARADLARLVAVLDTLRAAGFPQLVLVE
ncbi:MAG: ExbD/TolR family protein [Jhaorihella sp.]